MTCQWFKCAATQYDKTEKTIDFLMRTIQKAFHDVSVVTSGNKMQMKSTIFKSVQANNEKLFIAWINITNKPPIKHNLFGIAVDL